MTVKPVQLNMDPKFNPSFKEQKEYKSYLEAENSVKTEGLVKPLPPKGHLVGDNIISGTKYFFKDIGYDIKSVINGYKGTANDHQLGKLNDVGLRLGGIGIAAYLASRTSDPKARIMEYVGLGAFLAAMSIYPKLAINAPARIIHGYDIDKEYIDDQGRKKSVQQDSNYVPYDMYQGAKKDEDIDIIGDRMGIPRDIKNRHDVIKEQMRKIATQNNTLWMLTAGFATPLITALTCCGIENYVVAPALAKNRNKKADQKIEEAFSKIKTTFANETTEASENILSKKVEKIISNYKQQILPQEEFDNIVKYLTEGLEGNTAIKIEEELNKLLNPKNEKGSETVLKKINKAISNSKIKITAEELDNLIEKTSKRNLENEVCYNEFRKSLLALLEDKIAVLDISADKKTTLKKIVNKNIGNLEISGEIKSRNSNILTDEVINKLNNLAKIIGEFKENKQLLDSCKHFKLEFAPETILARSYADFEKAFLKELGVTYQDLKKMRKDSEYTKKLLDERLTAIAKDEAKFKKTMENLVSVMSDMDTTLNGANEQEPLLKKLANGFEYLYNGTAKRLNKLGGFEETIKCLIEENNADMTKLEADSAEDFFRLLDKTSKSLPHMEQRDRIREMAKGCGSDKYNALNGIFSRYNENISGFNRIFHTIDSYRRLFADKELTANLASKDPEYTKEVLQFCKNVLLKAEAGDQYQKLHVEEASHYLDIMNTLFATSADHKQGVVTDATREALENCGKASKWNLLNRLKDYIAKTRNIFSNDTTYFSKPAHSPKDFADKNYGKAAQTPVAKSDIVGQNLIDFLQKAAERRYNSQKWVRTMSIALGSVLGVTLLAQFTFGKIRNPHNLQKQVNNNDSN